MEDYFVTFDTRTGRKIGDHGTAEQAINWALDHNPDGSHEAETFLRSWRQGAAEEWPDFYAWLAKQDAAS